MNASRAAFLLVGLTAAAGGCNLVLGIGEPELVSGTGGAGGGATSTTGGAGGGGQGDGGAPPSPCEGVECNDGNPCTDDFCVVTAGEAKCKFQFDASKDVSDLDADENCLEVYCDETTESVASRPDDFDAPFSMNACIVYECAMGAVVDTPNVGASCSDGSGMCTAQGLCSTCQSSDQCGTSTFCAVYGCVAGQCEVSFVQAGTPTPGQSTGDCKVQRCTGSSAVAASEPDPTDVFDDGNDCTDDLCDDGVPTNPPLAPREVCAKGVCNGQGQCVECYDLKECVGAPSGTSCLATSECGCSVKTHCAASPYGQQCLTGTQECGCVSGSDCILPYAAGKYCVSGRCTNTAP